MKKILFTLLTTSLLITALLSCHRNELKSLQWNSKQGEAPASLKTQLQSLESQKPTMQFKSLKVKRAALKADDFEFQDLYIQAIAQSDGKWVEAVSSEIPSLSPNQIQTAEKLEKNRLQWVSRYFENKAPQWKVDSSQVVFATSDKGWVPVIQVVAWNADETDVFRILLASGGQLLSKDSIAQEFTTGEATVYPGRPDQTHLALQTLTGLKGNGYLSSKYIQLVTTLEKPVFSPTNVFSVDLTEPQFDDLQAFYFAQKSTQWFEDELSLTLSTPLEVKVHMGAPRKTNTAFYYDRKIRLGDGDGETFENMSRDPTIVSHEVAHAIIDMIAHLPFQDEGGSINEGMADYFASEITGEHLMAAYSYVPGPFRRDIDNHLRADKDLSGKLYGDSLVISGTLYSLKKSLDPKKVRAIAVKTLMKLGPYGNFERFPKALREAAESELDTKELATFDHIVFNQKGWPRNEIKGN